MVLGPNNRKILNLASPGTATSMGGDDFDYLTLWFENTDLTAGVYAAIPRKATVATPTEFRDNRLRFLNPAQTKSLRVRTLEFTEDYDLTIPFLTSSDEFLFVDHPSPIYGKTININDNTITATSQSSGDLLKNNGSRFLRMARGLPGQVLTVKTDGLDLEWKDPTAVVPQASGIPDDNSVSTIKIQNSAVTADKLASNAVTTAKVSDNAVTTAKILDGNVTNTKLAGSITGSKLVNGTITGTQIASSTVTNANLAGSISEDKLNPITNIDKLPASVRYDWSQVKPAALTLTTANGAEGIWAGHMQTIGTYTNRTTTSTNYRMRWTTAASTNAQAGIRTDFAYIKPQHSTPTNGYALKGKITWEAAETELFLFIGLVANTPVFPTPGQGVSTWMSGIAGIGIWADLPGAANIRTARNDGTTPITGIDISPTTTWSGGGTHVFTITYNAATPSWTINWDGTDNTYTTDIPPVNTPLGMLAYIETKNGTAKNFDISYLQAICAAH